MKKLLSAVLAAAMCCVMAVPAFAADTVIVPDEDGNPNPETGDIKVSYSVSPTYTVTIPGEVTLGQTATISAQNVRVAKGSQVEVALTGINNGDSQFILTTTEGASINYTVQNASQQDVALNATVLAVDPQISNSGSAALSFIAPSDTAVTYAGTYEGYVTFTVSIGNADTSASGGDKGEPGPTDPGEVTLPEIP